MITLEAVREHAATAPDRVAVSDGQETLTWAELADRVAAVRAWLTRSLDADESNRAMVIAGNTVRVVVATAALTSLGIPWVGVDPERDGATIGEQLAAVEPTFIVVDSSLPNLPEDFWPRWGDTAVLLDLVAFPAFDTRVTHYLAVAEGEHQPAPWVQPPFSALGFTSGTTGTPKLFVRRKRTENQRVAFLRDRFAFGPGDSFLITSPLAFASGHVWAGAALALGAAVRLGPPDAEAAVEVLATERLTGAFFVPPFLDRVLEAATTTHRGADLTALRFLLTGGRHISPRTIDQTRSRLGDLLYVYYATTETGINTMADPADLAAAPYAAGRFMPGVTVRALDPDTLGELPPGRVGLLAIDSAYAMDEYVHRPLDTVELDGRRHILTSDYGYLGDDGRLYITARSEPRLDVVRVEGAIKEDPAVRDVCVTSGLDGADTGAVAVVVLRPGLAPELRDRALARAGEVLGRFAGPARVTEAERIPYNSAGKVALLVLREELAVRLSAA
ncbi:acyl--CoA ligase [Streptomyces sp. NEAU-sy36]|uniref:class I adenylate-forming enzyme family protein n=1 Tax=unclassified Streptomyces TaxID=2593676 RepID=UPI0015D5A041|nr:MULTISPECIES: class I adenylate-forming enzyme family protein [unclassified Streptomyces]QLJ04521.1 acyl--CoA ligase [Streptomyces sp. NEAU-sy36]